MFVRVHARLRQISSSSLYGWSSFLSRCAERLRNSSSWNLQRWSSVEIQSGNSSKSATLWAPTRTKMLGKEVWMGVWTCYCIVEEGCMLYGINAPQRCAWQLKNKKATTTSKQYKQQRQQQHHQQQQQQQLKQNSFNSVEWPLSYSWLFCALSVCLSVSVSVSLSLSLVYSCFKCL